VTLHTPEQLVLDLDLVVGDDVEFGDWVRSLPATPWWRGEERDE
jgi:hypothetical protein